MSTQVMRPASMAVAFGLNCFALPNRLILIDGPAVAVPRWTLRVLTQMLNLQKCDVRHQII
jgi:hypothetical protein